MARNRMIKPEFWEDDKIGECSPTARLLFIALWNFADDEGYLEYRTKWLKAKCFPYDKLEIEPLIDELVRVGRVEIRENIIWVVHFLDHQRIEKPKKSDLSQMFNDSPTPPRPLPDSSPPKEKRREEKEIESEFEKFWKEYPEKKGKGKAWEIYKRLKPDLLILLSALAEQKKEKVALKERKAFCPEWKHPATWLNGKCWTDEVSTTESPPEKKTKTDEEILAEFNSS